MATYTVFHGTDGLFRDFSNKSLGSANGTAPINMVGFNFTDSIDVARTFGKRIIQAQVTIDRPLVINAKSASYSDFKHVLNAKLSRVSKTKYDGVIIKNYLDAGKYGDDYIKSNHYIPFDLSQIKVTDSLLEGLIKTPTVEVDDIMKYTMKVLLGFFYCAFLYETDVEQEKRNQFLSTILRYGSKYSIYEDELKHITKDISAEDYIHRRVNRMLQSRSYKMKTDKGDVTYFAKITAGGLQPHYNVMDQQILIDVMWALEQQTDPDYVWRDKDVRFCYFRSQEINELIVILKSTIRHEMMHCVQHLTFGSKDSRQVSMGNGYSDKEDKSGYYTSNVEFYPQIETSLAKFETYVSDALLYQLSLNDPKTLRDMIEFFVSDKDGEMVKSFNTSMGKINITRNAFFNHQKRAFLSQKDTKKRNLAQFTYQRAIREFYKEIMAKIQKVKSRNALQ
jgi:hypothetical protein